jgi:hypothetical protein
MGACWRIAGLISAGAAKAQLKGWFRRRIPSICCAIALNNRESSSVSIDVRSAIEPEAFIQKALELLASERYFEKGMAVMALTERRPAEIFFSAKFSLPALPGARL